MKTWKRFVVVMGAFLAASAQVIAQPIQVTTAGLSLVSRDELPRYGTFWIKQPNGFTAPSPCPPPGNHPVYQIDEKTFIVDKTEMLLQLDESTAMVMSADSMFFPFFGEEESSNPPTAMIVDTRRNYEKFANQGFSLIDTNYAASYDTNLYDVCISFPPVTGTDATLQIQRYGNGVVIRALNFDYAAESRDFALIVCDDVARPTWKEIDFDGVSDAQDGWLVQGTVPNWKVAGEMFFQVTNISAQAIFFGPFHTVGQRCN